MTSTCMHLPREMHPGLLRRTTIRVLTTGFQPLGVGFGSRVNVLLLNLRDEN
jgi:hypothetical protein